MAEEFASWEMWCCQTPCIHRELALAGRQLTEPLPKGIGDSSHSFNSTETPKIVTQAILSNSHFCCGNK